MIHVTLNGRPITLHTSTYQVGGGISVHATGPEGPEFTLSINVPGANIVGGPLDPGEFVVNHDVPGYILRQLSMMGAMTMTTKRAFYGYCEQPVAKLGPLWEK